MNKKTKQITFKAFFEAQLANIDRFKDALSNILDEKEVAKDSYIYNWFMTKYVKWYQSPDSDETKSLNPHSYKDGEPSWMSKDNVMDFAGFRDQDINKIYHIVDYFNTLDEREQSKLYKQDYNTVTKKVSDWDASMAKMMSKKTSSNLVEGEDYKVIRDLGNYRWVELLSKKAYNCEGDTMGHCVGGYTPGSQDILSLWDENNESHVTIEIKNKKITQIKGKLNAAPVEKYQQPTINIVKYLISNGYKVTNDGTNDGTNIGMILWNNEYYFEDSSEWENVYINQVQPEQEKAINNILDRIEIVDVT